MLPATGKRQSSQRWTRQTVGRIPSGWVLRIVVIFLAVAPVRKAWAEGDTLFGALIMATNNDDHPAPVPPELAKQAANLESVFGYNEFRLVGQKHQPLTTATEDWLVSGHRFFLKINTKNPVMGGYALAVQLLKENRVLVDADVKLSRERPLFIRGPFVGQGQLIILLMVQ